MNCSETKFNTTQETGDRMRDMNKLKARAAAALDKFKRNQTRIAECNRGPEAGDEYVFAETAGAGVLWVVVLSHKDDPELLYCLPGDMSPMIGTHDVQVPEECEAGPGTIRCGLGLWLSRAFITAAGARSGFHEDRHVDQTLIRLSAMVTGTDDARIDLRPEIDHDPDYHEWIDEVTAAACRLEQAESMFSETQQKH